MMMMMLLITCYCEALALQVTSCHNPRHTGKFQAFCYTVSQKTGPLKQVGITFVKTSPLAVMSDYCQNALAFYCGLITFKKLDVGRVPPVYFLWQQEDPTRSRRQSGLARYISLIYIIDIYRIYVKYFRSNFNFYGVFLNIF